MTINAGNQRREYRVLVILAAVSLFLYIVVGGVPSVMNFVDQFTLPLRRAVWGVRVNILSSDEQIARLENELSQARSQIAEMGKLIDENKVLLLQQKIAATTPRVKVLAQITGETSGFGWIDKGSLDGVVVGQVVVQENVVVGRVDSVLQRSARVAFPTSSRFRLVAWVKGELSGGRRADGLIVGLGGKARLTKVLRKEKIAEGDLVVSAGTSGEPADLVIGVLRRISEDAGGVYQEAEIEIAARLEELQSVFVIIN